MSTTALTAATNLLERIRDVGGLSLSVQLPASLTNGQAFAYYILSIAQRCVNALEQNYLVTVPWASTPYQTTYHIDSDPTLGTGGTNPVIKIIGIKDGNVDLVFSPFQQIWQSDFGWFRRTTGGISHTWSRFGRDAFVIYPAMERPYNFNIVAIPYIPDFSAGTVLFSVTDDLVPEIMDVAEAMALFKLGQYDIAAQVLERFTQRYNLSVDSNRWKKAMSGIDQ